jgi:hypothetical protein
MLLRHLIVLMIDGRYRSTPARPDQKDHICLPNTSHFRSTIPKDHRTLLAGRHTALGMHSLFTMFNNTPTPVDPRPSGTSGTCQVQRNCPDERTAIPKLRSPRQDGKGWWSQTGSNRRPHACKARALPTELWPQWARGPARQLGRARRAEVVGLGGLEPPTSRLSSARSNQLSYKPATSNRSNRPDACSSEERETKTASSRQWGSARTPDVSKLSNTIGRNGVS